MFYSKKSEIEYKKRIKEISDMIKNDSKNPNLYDFRASSYYMLSQLYYDVFEKFNPPNDKNKYVENVNNALNDTNKAIELGITDLYVYIFRVFMLKKLKRWNDVIKYCLELKLKQIEFERYGEMLGEAYFNTENWQKCIDVYNSMIDIEGENESNLKCEEMFIKRGISYQKLNKPKMALKDYFKHIELNGAKSLNFDIYGLIASVYTELGDTAKTNRAYSESINLIASKYMESGNIDDAIVEYSKSIKLYPKNHYIYFLRGMLYCDSLHDYALAAEDFDNAIEYINEKYDDFDKTIGYIEHENDDLYYHWCGYAYVHKGQQAEIEGNYLQALKDYDRAIFAYQKQSEVNNEANSLENFNLVSYAINLKNKLLKEMEK